MKAPETRRGGRYAMAERDFELFAPAPAECEHRTMGQLWHEYLDHIPRAPLCEVAGHAHPQSTVDFIVAVSRGEFA